MDRAELLSIANQHLLVGHCCAEILSMSFKGTKCSASHANDLSPTCYRSYLSGHTDMKPLQYVRFRT